MPNALPLNPTVLSMVTLKPATGLALGFLPSLYWCYKNIIQERNINRKGLKKRFPNMTWKMTRTEAELEDKFWFQR